MRKKTRYFHHTNSWIMSRVMHILMTYKEEVSRWSFNCSFKHPVFELVRRPLLVAVGAAGMEEVPPGPFRDSGWRSLTQWDVTESQTQQKASQQTNKQTNKPTEQQGGGTQGCVRRCVLDEVAIPPPPPETRVKLQKVVMPATARTARPSWHTRSEQHLVHSWPLRWAEEELQSQTSSPIKLNVI